jgi:hypothetical protein
MEERRGEAMEEKRGEARQWRRRELRHINSSAATVRAWRQAQLEALFATPLALFATAVASGVALVNTHGVVAHEERRAALLWQG